MIVHAYGQSVAALQAPAFKHLPTISISHTGTKSMHSQAASNFWLISTFRHF
jgi:hypothetical protein